MRPLVLKEHGPLGMGLPVCSGNASQAGVVEGLARLLAAADALPRTIAHAAATLKPLTAADHAARAAFVAARGSEGLCAVLRRSPSQLPPCCSKTAASLPVADAALAALREPAGNRSVHGSGSPETDMPELPAFLAPCDREPTPHVAAARQLPQQRRVLRHERSRAALG